MAILNFARRNTAPIASNAHLTDFLDGYSIEVMPRTADKVDDFRTLLPTRTRVYIAHIDGTPIQDMVATAARLARNGFDVMPHFPARIIQDQKTLRDWITRYQSEAGVRQGLILAGGVAQPRGEFHSSMQLLETGEFDRAGFTQLNIAGHPEGNRDIEPNGTDKAVMEALHWKRAFSERTDAKMAIATQFAFDAAPIIAWADRLKFEGIELPVHVGIAGPAKLQTLIKFAIACGVGPSLKVLQKRAMDVTKLVLPYEPLDVLTHLAQHRVENPDSLIKQAHIFPLGGIGKAAEWITEITGSAP